MIADIKEKYIVLSSLGCKPIIINEKVNIPKDITKALEYLINPTLE
jgi:hypothetical protein